MSDIDNLLTEINSLLSNTNEIVNNVHFRLYGNKAENFAANLSIGQVLIIIKAIIDLRDRTIQK